MRHISSSCGLRRKDVFVVLVWSFGLAIGANRAIVFRPRWLSWPPDETDRSRTARAPVYV